MKLLLIGNSELEHDIFRLALGRLHLAAELFGAKDCESAIASLLSNVIPVPDFIFLDTDVSADANSCLKMLKDSTAVGLSKIVLYSSSRESEEIKLLINMGAKSHIFKSYNFKVFCQDLRNMLAEPNDSHARLGHL